MAAYRLYSQLQTWFGNNGILLAGGYLKFYGASSLVAQSVYGEKALTTNNGATVLLDASGRLVNAVWASTASAYFVELYDATNVKQGEEDNVEVPASPVPVPSAAQYVGGNGTTYVLKTYSGLPDQTGHANEYLKTDATTASWSAISNADDLKQAVTAAATTNIDYSLGATVALAQAVAITSLTFTNLPSTGTSAYIVITRTKDATATSRAITWPASIKWEGGTAPSLTQTTGGIDVIALLTYDAGTTFFGKYMDAVA